MNAKPKQEGLEKEYEMPEGVTDWVFEDYENKVLRHFTADLRKSMGHYITYEVGKPGTIVVSLNDKIEREINARVKHIYYFSKDEKTGASPYISMTIEQIGQVNRDVIFQDGKFREAG